MTRRPVNLILAAALVAVAVAGALVARALPSSGGGGGALAAEPYTSRWLCPVVPRVKGELTIANAGTTEAVLRATRYWDRSVPGEVVPLTTGEGEDEAPPATTTTRPSEEEGDEEPAEEGEASGQEETTTSAAEETTTTAAAPPEPQSDTVLNGQPLPPGEQRTLSYGSNDRVPALLEVESFGAPIAVNGTGQPACVASAGQRWWLPAAEVRGSGDSRIVVANPGTEGAVVEVSLFTTTVDYTPKDLRRLFIPGRSARVVRVSRFVPSSPEQSVRVSALHGRVVVGGLTTEAAGDKTPVIVPAQPGGREEWTFAGGLAGDAGETQLYITNPSEDLLRVDVEVVTGKEALPLPGAEDIELAGNTIKIIPVDTDADGPVGVRVRSLTGTPFDAGLVVTPSSDEPRYVDAGGGERSDRWFLPSVGSQPITVANFGDRPLTYRLGALGGEQGEGVELEPNRVAFVDELPEDAPGLIVSADRPGLVVRPAGGPVAVPGEWIGGLPVGGDVRPGPAAG